MFVDFYSLRDQPFGFTPDPRFLYPGRRHREALASLQYGIECGAGFGVLLSEPGLGKTTLLFHLLDRIRNDDLSAFLFETQCDAVGLLRYLLRELDAAPRSNDPVSLHEQLHHVLATSAQNGRRVILIIDEAQNLDRSVLETVRLLSNFETPRRKLLHTILAGQPQLMESLSSPDMMQLHQRIPSFSWLAPLDREEVSCYIAHRLHTAGYRGEPLFTDCAAEFIAEHSKGIPRKINQICFHSMTLGCLKEHRFLDVHLVSEAMAGGSARQLGLQDWNSPPPAIGDDSGGEAGGQSGWLPEPPLSRTALPEGGLEPVNAKPVLALSVATEATPLEQPPAPSPAVEPLGESFSPFEKGSKSGDPGEGPISMVRRLFVKSMLLACLFLWGARSTGFPSWLADEETMAAPETTPPVATAQGTVEVFS